MTTDHISTISTISCDITRKQPLGSEEGLGLRAYMQAQRQGRFEALPVDEPAVIMGIRRT